MARIRRREAIRAFFDSPLSEGQAMVLPLRLSAILLRTTDHALAFDLGWFTLRRREIEDLLRLDAQFVTHVHFDHWSSRLACAIHERTEAPAVVEPQIVERGRISAEWLLSARPGVPVAIDDMRITPITGRHAGPITLFHIALPELSVFHGGDSGHVPLDQWNADLAFVPVGGPAPSCSPESAAAIVRDLQPRVAIPMHGFARQKRSFERLATTGSPETRAVVLPRWEPAAIDL